MGHGLMKSCAGCHGLFKATGEFFDQNSSTKDGLQTYCRKCQKLYRKEHRKGALEYGKLHYAENRDKYRDDQQDYYHTKVGYLRSLHGAITGRCSKQQSYTSRGIKNLFRSSDEFVDYVINILQVDPRDLDCHRIDSNGNYEPGNIEFLTKEEHQKIHKGAPC